MNHHQGIRTMGMIKTKTELMAYLEKVGYNQSDYRIAVEALIFTPQGKLILEKRGKRVKDEVGKLEGVGGGIDYETDLHEALRDEIKTELGPDVKVHIEQLLEIRQVQFEEVDKGPQNWVVVSYLCRLLEGEPMIAEPGKIESLHELTMDELYAMDAAKLSRSTIAARKVYQAKYGNRPFYKVHDNGQ